MHVYVRVTTCVNVHVPAFLGVSPVYVCVGVEVSSRAAFFTTCAGVCTLTRVCVRVWMCSHRGVRPGRVCVRVWTCVHVPFVLTCNSLDVFARAWCVRLVYVCISRYRQVHTRSEAYTPVHGAYTQKRASTSPCTNVHTRTPSYKRRTCRIRVERQLNTLQTRAHMHREARAHVFRRGQTRTQGVNTKKPRAHTSRHVHTSA